MLKLLSFDIDDTIAESKQPLTNKMAKLLARLSHNYYLHFVTGGALKLIIKNTINPITKYGPKFNNILVSANVGALLVHFQNNNSYKVIYEKPIPKKDFIKIKAIFEKALQKVGHNPQQVYGKLIEYRTYSITFSAYGQNAPLEVKSQYDPTREKRKQIVKYLTGIEGKYQIAIAGKSSIDITIKGINKGFALKQVQKYLNLAKAEILLFGDSLMPGGNDYSVMQVGFNVVNVTCWQDTYNYLKSNV